MREYLNGGDGGGGKKSVWSTDHPVVGVVQSTHCVIGWLVGWLCRVVVFIYI